MSRARALSYAPASPLALRGSCSSPAVALVLTLCVRSVQPTRADGSGLCALLQLHQAGVRPGAKTSQAATASSTIGAHTGQALATANTLARTLATTAESSNGPAIRRELGSCNAVCARVLKSLAAGAAKMIKSMANFPPAPSFFSSSVDFDICQPMLQCHRRTESLRM